MCEEYGNSAGKVGLIQVKITQAGEYRKMEIIPEHMCCDL